MATSIAAGQNVLIRLPSEGMKIVELRPGGTISLGKFGSFRADGVVGYAFGQSFEIVENQGVRPINGLEAQIPELGAPEAADEAFSEGPSEPVSRAELTQMFTSADNNQNIIDIGSKIQKLTSDDVQQLKKLGASSDIGQKIIDQMVAGHGGFDKKTVFSQAKYLRRKQQKFLRRFTVDRLGPSQLLQYYNERDNLRVLDMSEELLGLLMAYANVKPGGKYLVVDETGGLVVYAMMERMRACLESDGLKFSNDVAGTIVVVHENEHPNHVVLRYSPFSAEQVAATVRNVNWLQFTEPENERILWEELLPEELAALKPSKQLQHERRKNRASDINQVLDMVVEGNFDAFVCVGTLSMSSVLPCVLPAVGGSRPIALYSQHKEVLLEAQHYLTADKRVLAPSIFETRMRPYQTIPGRMHPEMTMRGYGGYVLWGTRVLPQESGITAIGRGLIRKREEAEEARDHQQGEKKATSEDEDKTDLALKP